MRANSKAARREASLFQVNAGERRMALGHAAVDEADARGGGVVSPGRDRAFRAPCRGAGVRVQVVELIPSRGIQLAHPLQRPTRVQPVRRPQHHHAQVQTVEGRVTRRLEAGGPGRLQDAHAWRDRDHLTAHHRRARLVDIDGLGIGPDQFAKPDGPQVGEPGLVEGALRRPEGVFRAADDRPHRQLWHTHGP